MVGVELRSRERRKGTGGGAVFAGDLRSIPPRRVAVKTKKGENEKVRVDTGKRMGGVSGLRTAYLAGDGRITAADGADSGELFRRPGGTIYLGFEGERRGTS